MTRLPVILLLGCLLAGLVTPSASASHRTRRTIGSSSSFINCLVVSTLDESNQSDQQQQQQRFCSYDHAVLEAIEKAPEPHRSCPEGRVFRVRCNTCECGQGGRLSCTGDLCAEDFFDVATGLPKMW